jgi:hypothetical protein
MGWETYLCFTPTPMRRSRAAATFLDHPHARLVREERHRPVVDRRSGRHDPQVSPPWPALKRKGPLIIAMASSLRDRAEYREQMRAQQSRRPANAAFNY